MDISKLQLLINDLYGYKNIAIVKIGGGKNSRVYHLKCNDDLSLVAKIYYKNENKNRFKVEHSALCFLRDNGISCVPDIIHSDQKNGYIIYKYIEGIKLNSNEIKHKDIDKVVDFIKHINKLKLNKNAKYLPDAAEACTSISSVISNIEFRLERLLKIDHTKLKKYLEQEFIPHLKDIKQLCKKQANEYGYAFNKSFPLEDKILSPSDFSFHNILKTNTGDLFFLDFEYFGWDDPVKLISDFLLHPGTNLNNNLKKYFLNKILKIFPLQQRLEIMYPLFGLKWCLILLNEFLKDNLNRREFANHQDLDISKLHDEQLIKARQMNNKVDKLYNLLN